MQGGQLGQHIVEVIRQRTRRCKLGADNVDEREVGMPATAPGTLLAAVVVDEPIPVYRDTIDRSGLSRRSQ